MSVDVDACRLFSGQFFLVYPVIFFLILLFTGAMEQHAIRVFDLQSFDEVAHWPLLDGEECLCLTAATHPAWSADSLQDSSGGGGSSMGDNSSSCGVMGAPEGKCIVVGTAFSADDQEYEPSAGRVLVLSLTLHKSGAGGFGGLSSTGGGASSPARTSPSSRGGSFSPSGAAGTSGSSSGGGLAGGASLDVLCERAIKGAVYDVSPLGHSMLACGVGPKVLREKKICSNFCSSCNRDKRIAPIPSA